MIISGGEIYFEKSWLKIVGQMTFIWKSLLTKYFYLKIISSEVFKRENNFIELFWINILSKFILEFGLYVFTILVLEEC